MQAKEGDYNKNQHKLSDNILKISEYYQIALGKIIKLAEQNVSQDAGKFCEDYAQILSTIYSNYLKEPDKILKSQIELWTNLTKIWSNVLGNYLGEKSPPLYDSQARDRRFKDKAWEDSIYFNFLKQSYLYTADWSKKFVDSLEVKDLAEKRKLNFINQQIINAISPTNFVFTNPEVIKATVESEGENLVNGFENLIRDLDNSKKYLNITTSDHEKFELGRNIATSEGNVIYRNELMELIHFKPMAKKIYDIPILLVPAWINKYYIFDLSSDNSFIKWQLEQGYDVFVISWVNPGSSLADKKFEDYMLDGAIRAIDIVSQASGEGRISLMGYCLGGTLLVATLAYLAAKGEDKNIVSLSLLTTLVDFSDVGDMAMFIDEKKIDYLEDYMEKKGYFDSDDMVAIFSILRANDLIWSFVVNNYLLGNNPLPFDILYWNSDSTRLPATAHSFYLRNMYLRNSLIKPNGIILDGVAIDVRKINTSIYLLSTKEDHIAPWKTTYNFVNSISGDKEFVLSASGHIAGVINPPIKNKYCHWTNSNNENDPEKWFNNAKQHDGSWWPNWSKWQSSFMGEKISNKKWHFKSLGKAPGDYVEMK